LTGKRGPSNNAGIFRGRADESAQFFNFTLEQIFSLYLPPPILYSNDHFNNKSMTLIPRVEQKGQPIP
jgi:hypothetical protein